VISARVKTVRTRLFLIFALAYIVGWQLFYGFLVYSGDLTKATAIFTVVELNSYPVIGGALAWYVYSVVSPNFSLSNVLTALRNPANGRSSGYQGGYYEDNS